MAAESVRQIMGKVREMKSRIPKSMHVPLVIAGVAALSFSTVALTNVPFRWFHSPFEGLNRISAQEDVLPAPAELLSTIRSGISRLRVKTSCEECGVVDSVRRVALSGNAPATYEITVRMRDGSARVVNVASHGNWRPRERITLIGGGRPSGR